MLYFFAWRDFKVKYRQTFLGVVWALLQPLGMMLVFLAVFSKGFQHQLSGSSLAYPVFILSALIFWNFFYSAVSQAAESMINNADIIKKIWFPRLVIPLAAIFSSLIDLAISLLLFLIVCLVVHQSIDLSALLYLPLSLLICFIAALGLGSLIGALNVKYRDFRYALPFLLQMLFFGSAIFYSLDIIANATLKNLLAVNPVNAAIELFRPTLTKESVDFTVVGIGSCSAIVMAAVGIIYFRKTEAYFADII